jgi:hypothetical protein
MLREVKVSSYEAALNYAYLEHLLRITTPEAEVQTALSTFPMEIKVLMQPLIAEKRTSPQRAIRGLETNLTLIHLAAKLTPEVKVLALSLENGAVRESVKDPSESGEFPLLNILQARTQFFMLYTPEMSYLDGFDPFREEDHFPIIPESFISSIKSKLYKSVYSVPQPKKTKTKQSRVEDTDFSQEVYKKPSSPKKTHAEIPVEVSESPSNEVQVMHEVVIVEKSADVPTSPKKPLKSFAAKTNKGPTKVKTKYLKSQEGSDEEITLPGDWKEVEYRILNQRKQRDECGQDCRLF